MSDENDTNQNSTDDQMLVVGLGASAGGLEALKTFFDSVPDETGMAFIVIVHLSPEHESRMAELLQMHSRTLMIRQVNERVEIEAEHVYVIPPDKLLSVGDNHLELSEPKDDGHGLATIDLFFRSLAESKGNRAACVILSGSGNDGTVGIKAVKEHGGLTIAQTPSEAKYAAMPQSAIESGLIDRELSLEEIPRELLNYKENLFNISITEDGDKDDEKQALQRIFTRVYSETGHDFSNYKRSSILRRIQRRMQVTRVADLPAYYSFIKEHPEEIDELFKDLLISVTNFFRDKEAFEALEQQAIPKLFEEKDRDDQLRVWVPGCATGEEAYSIAILLQEYAQEEVDYPPEIKIFASDIDRAALDGARQGRYPESITADVSQQRLDRFFRKEGPEYVVKREIREMILFARHDLLRDPPFSNQDLVACRNLLIYLNRELQAKVFNLFHYTLRSNGWLFLGLSDSNLEASELFSPANKKYRIYRCRSTARANLVLPQAPLRYSKEKDTSFSGSSRKNTHTRSEFASLHQELLAKLYAPQSVILNKNNEVLHATDGIQKYLEYRGGEPSHDIIEMIKPDLRQSLRNLLYKTGDEGTSSLTTKVRLGDDDQPKQLKIIVHAFRDQKFSENLLLVTFKEIKRPPTDRETSRGTNLEERSGDDNEIIESLEDELKSTKEQLQVTVEEYETSNEELRASNEELQSMNEELQSTTEELETSQEELQSVNEELKTVNQELENKVAELDQVNSDLLNLMKNTEVGIIFVDSNLRVKRYTNTAADIFNLISSDRGRPLEHVTHKLQYESLVDDVKHVHESLENMRKTVHTADGRWYIMRMRPYRSTENKIEGVVITFTEFTELRELQQALQEREFQESLATLGMYALEKNDLQSVLKRAIDIGCTHLELDCAIIYTIDKEENTFAIDEQAGLAKEGDPVALDEKWDVGYVSNHMDQPLVVNRYDEEERFGLSPYLEDEDVVSSVHIIVRGSEDMYGLLGFYSNEERSFNDTEIHFLQVLANIAGMAIQQHHVKEELRKETERSRQYQKEILNNSVSDRWELGGYLHDNLGQMLASAKITIDGLEQKLAGSDGDGSRELADAAGILDRCMNSIRDIAHDVIPVDIQEEGVEHAFRFLMRHTQKMHGINCTLEIGDIVDDIHDITVATHLYNIVQEAVKNATVHGEAENITVRLDEADGALRLQIIDDGAGLTEPTDENNGKGLRLMQHRMDLLGGSFAIAERSGDGETGTVITCTLPLDKLEGNGEM